jgi:phytanoyl-CoA hydroxylase
MTLQLNTETRGVEMYDGVNPEFVESYSKNGFAVLRQALSEDEVAAVNADALRLMRGELGEIEGAALDPDTLRELDDDDLMKAFLCIHNPHKVSSVALDVMHNEKVVAALKALIGPNVKSMQSMLFIKSEGKPGQAWHQDEHFIPTRDRSLAAAWIALDDANVDNGCLWVLPGSHARGVIYPDREQDDARFDCTSESYGFPYSEDDAVPVEIPAGAALVFNGYLLHRSLENSGKRGYRRAIVDHYMSAESLLPWGPLPTGGYVGGHDFRDIVMVAGSDPYEYKGTENILTTSSRPDKDGGCGR